MDVYPLFFLVLAALLAGAAVCHSDAKDTAVNTSVFEEQGISEKLLVYLFLDSIHKQTVQFYAPYYTEAPEIAYYFTTVKEMQKIGTDIRITFSISPYLGPHDSIGEDEVTFRVNPNGEITAENFRHLKNYPLPDNLLHLAKGELPPIST